MKVILEHGDIKCTVEGDSLNPTFAPFFDLMRQASLGVGFSEVIVNEFFEQD